MVHFPSEGVDRLVKDDAVPEAKYSCSTYPWAARPVGLADTGSMTCPVSGGVLNRAGAATRSSPPTSWGGRRRAAASGQCPGDDQEDGTTPARPVCGAVIHDVLPASPDGPDGHHDVARTPGAE